MLTEPVSAHRQVEEGVIDFAEAFRDAAADMGDDHPFEQDPEAGEVRFTKNEVIEFAAQDGVTTAEETELSYETVSRWIKRPRGLRVG